MRGTVSPPCLAAVKELVTHFGADNTYVLSKCGQNMQQGTVIFLTRNDFFGQTGLSPNNVIFCTERSGGTFKTWGNLGAPEDWAGVTPEDLKHFGKGGPRVAKGKVGKGAVGKELGMTCLIDDRIDCHASFLEDGSNCDDIRLVHFCSPTGKGDPMITLTTNVWPDVVECLVGNPKPAGNLTKKSEEPELTMEGEENE
jgi:hypothetical protein